MLYYNAQFYIFQLVPGKTVVAEYDSVIYFATLTDEGSLRWCESPLATLEDEEGSTCKKMLKIKKYNLRKNFSSTWDKSLIHGVLPDEYAFSNSKLITHDVSVLENILSEILHI